MKRRLLPILAVALGLYAAAIDAQDRSASDSELTEILVTGDQPGPALWKVSKGGHTLWILGQYTPLPKDMTWHSAAVRDVVSRSQELIGWGGVQFEIDSSAGMLDKFKAGSALNRFKKNPDGAKLADVVAPETYAKWGVLKAKYLGRDSSVEKLRPLFAADVLQKAATKRMGLDDEKARTVTLVISSLQKQYRIKAQTPRRTIQLRSKDLAEAMKNLSAVRLNDSECFAQTVNGLESRLFRQRARANAWAVGDVDALIRLNQSPPSQECTDLVVVAMLGVTDLTDQDRVRRAQRRMEDEFDAATAQLRADWVGLAEDALDKNRVTFGVLPIYELVGADGTLALLAQKGYAIQSPADGVAAETGQNADR